MILVDEARWPHRGQHWAHLVSDRSYEELHAFAGRLGISRRAFQGDHYDVPAPVREQAIALGAQSVASRELLARLRAAGLRLGPSARRLRASGGASGCGSGGAGSGRAGSGRALGGASGGSLGHP